MLRHEFRTPNRLPDTQGVSRHTRSGNHPAPDGACFGVPARTAGVWQPPIANSEVMPNTSIEIKGGSDVSNVHNRIGEAEKSHLKAKVRGFARFWTIVKAKIDPATARQQPPTTTDFFNLQEIQVKSHEGHKRFKALLHQTLGIS
jgi:XcyI restriction endonuclease